MDGASRLRTFWEIILPISWPGLATTAIITFIYCWNEFLFALSFTLGPERQTVPVAIALFRGQYQVPWGQFLAAAVLATAPVAVLVLIFQRRIVSGLTAGAVLAVDQKGAIVEDRHNRKPWARDPFARKVQLPNERAGTLIVFKVFDRMSYALVIGARGPMRVADRVYNP